MKPTLNVARRPDKPRFYLKPAGKIWQIGDREWPENPGCVVLFRSRERALKVALLMNQEMEEADVETAPEIEVPASHRRQR